MNKAEMRAYHRVWQCQYRLDHPERVAAADARSRKKNCRAPADAKYRRKNRDEINAKRRARYAESQGGVVRAYHRAG